MASYLGLDLGTYCGWAFECRSPQIGTLSVHGTWDCSVKRGHDSPALRFEIFEQHLSGVLAIGCDRVFYELVRRHKGPQAAHAYGGYMAVMQKTCDRFGVPFQGLEVGTIKKFCTGRGNASKEMMIAGVQRWGYPIADDADDEADAIAILRCGADAL